MRSVEDECEREDRQNDAAVPGPRWHERDFSVRGCGGDPEAPRDLLPLRMNIFEGVADCHRHWDPLKVREATPGLVDQWIFLLDRMDRHARPPGLLRPVIDVLAATQARIIGS
ncbi:hypothetical protein [Nonomuraea mesophila]|uniref:hypothetical protein n=1 Tax=Nonomuraea mesophila TaxID=2530382 RepID=UPI00140E23F3|nr:hypothetical protein [Nonomuraea mesophila]